MYLRLWKEEPIIGTTQKTKVRYVMRILVGRSWPIVVIRKERCLAGCWQVADTAIRMFAELLSQSDDLAGIYAAETDRRRVAGLACEAAYADVQRRSDIETHAMQIRGVIYGKSFSEVVSVGYVFQ